jgi:hypothetical protein
MSSPFDRIMIESDVEQLEEADLSLLETLDHVLNRGLVITGEITISVADIDLIFVGLNVLVSHTQYQISREGLHTASVLQSGDRSGWCRASDRR